MFNPYDKLAKEIAEKKRQEKVAAGQKRIWELYDYFLRPENKDKLDACYPEPHNR